MKPTNTVEKEIARLYKKGKTESVPYICSSVAQTFMNLYLVQKHGIKNPFYEDIIAEYKRYGRICARYTPWITVPMQGIWELNVFFDKKDNVLKHNADEIVDIYIDNIVCMVNMNPGKKFALEFNSAVYVDGVVASGHSEMILYDPAFNTIEYVDSNNLPKQCSRKDKQYFSWTEIRSETVRRIVSGLPYEPLLVTNADIYGGYAWGIQSLEAASDLLTEDERQGYCLMWSHLFADLAMQFPDSTVKEIVEAIIKKSKSKTVSVKYANDYMVFLIRGYVSDISNVHSVGFTSAESLREACCRIAGRL
jgi:hypothetical protein